MRFEIFSPSPRKQNGMLFFHNGITSWFAATSWLTESIYTNKLCNAVRDGIPLTDTFHMNYLCSKITARGWFWNMTDGMHNSTVLHVGWLTVIILDSELRTGSAESIWTTSVSIVTHNTKLLLCFSYMAASIRSVSYNFVLSFTWKPYLSDKWSSRLWPWIWHEDRSVTVFTHALTAFSSLVMQCDCHVRLSLQISTYKQLTKQRLALLPISLWAGTGIAQSV